MFDPAFVEDDDLVRQRHGFDLIVGHIDHRRLEVGVQLGDFDPHLNAERSVQIGQRFVEQEDVRSWTMARPMATLALAAGQGFGLALEQRFKLEDRAAFWTRRSISALGFFAIFRPKAMLS